jgi:hypothetical protein
MDHTGLDIIAYNPKTGERLGVSVKSRTRNEGKEETHVNMLSYQKGKDDRQKLLDACKAFSCEPYLAAYVETAISADLYLISLKHYDSKYRSIKKKAIDDWKMGGKYKALYSTDPFIKHIHITFDTQRWD